MRFKDQVVVVTGSARGIGFATASLAAQEGAAVVVTDLEEKDVEAAVALIKAEGGNAIGIAGDVGDLSQVRKNVDEIMAACGRIDVLVNNAGIIAFGPAKELQVNVWRRVIQVSLDGTFFWSQTAAVASMIPRRKGVIVNVASAAGLSGVPNCAPYVAAKHGVVGLTKALAVEWGQYNIRVNCSCPGFTWTDLTRTVADQNPALMEERVRRIPIGRGALPEEQARAILFLASSDSEALSGHAMGADGGNLALNSGFAVPRDPV